MIDMIFFSIFAIIGIILVFFYAVSVLPYLVILTVAGALMLWAFVCGDLAFGTMLFVTALVVLGGGLAYIKELVATTKATHHAYFRSLHNV